MKVPIPPSPLPGLCHKSVHGSTGSPRTDHGPREINYLAVRPEPVEGQAANYDTASAGERDRVRGGGARPMNLEDAYLNQNA